MQNEEGLPLTEIQEELDEEGNIVCKCPRNSPNEHLLMLFSTASTITHPGQAALEIVQALRQAGVTDLEPLKSSEGSLQHKVEANASRQEPRLGKPDMTYDTVPAQLPPPEPLSENLLDDSLKVATKAPKKSVTPAENIEAPEPVHIPTPAAPSEPASYRIGPALARGSFHRGGRVIELDENDQEIGSTPTIPLGESPEDAARRRAMLEYSLSEVGAVVAELDLEDVDSADSYDDGDNDDENGDIYADDDEEEDEFGRSLRPGITDEYRDKMLELEKKLNARMLENVGPMPHNPALEEVVKSAHRLVVQKDQVAVETGAGSYRSSRIAKKGVRFADELNISSDPKPVPDEERPAFKKLLEKSTVSESIVERSPSAATLSAQTETLRKISRFKSTRAAAMPFITQNVSGTAAKSVNTSVHPANKDEHPQSKTDVPGFEPGEVLTTNVLERPVSLCNVSGPDEDALNPAILQREAAVAYHKIRNQMIQRNGGFLPSERDKLEEEEQGPLMEEKDGKVKKVSRFKAAWLGAGGV